MLAGCPADDSGTDDGSNDDSGTTGDATATMTAGMTDPSMPTASTSMSGGVTTEPPDTDSATTEPTTVTDTETGSGGNLENGEQCMSNDECASGMCFLAGILGGICSECLTEEDCDWGCNLPNPLSDPPIGAMCGSGGLGEGCNTEDACMDDGHFCAEIIDVPGVLSASTCSECLTTADCTDPQVCNVVIRIEDIAGEKTCVDVGSVQDGEFCDLSQDDQNAPCDGFCASADIMGLVEFGVCGRCSNVDMANEGCADGETCQDPTVDLDGTVVASMCV